MAELARRLGTADAIAIGIASMIGAGLFAGIGPATEHAGRYLLVSLAIAGLIAFCNATSSAQLAARSPRAGGTYVYAGERLGGAWAFIAGWAFVAGKIASCAALARTFALYALPSPSRPLASLLAATAVILMTAINVRGVERTARASAFIAAIVLTAIAFSLASTLGVSRAGESSNVGPLGLLRGAGLLFFAFAGYARVATLGEEVRDPARTIPRAIPAALAITVVVYALVAESARHVLGSTGLAIVPIPVAEAVEHGRFPWLAPAARIGAVVATLGVLLSLLAGVGRTVLAMARERDLPRALDHVHERWRTPDRAEIVVGGVVAALAASVDVRASIGFSAFTIVLYYAITNAAALRMRADERRWPRALAVAGLAGCLLLAASLPVASMIGGLAVAATGLLFHGIGTRARSDG